LFRKVPEVKHNAVVILEAAVRKPTPPQDHIDFLAVRRMLLVEAIHKLFETGHR
jgi:hypothetical protein